MHHFYFLLFGSFYFISFFSLSYAFTFKDVRDLMLKFNLNPNNLYYNPNFHGSCTCGGNAIPVSAAIDTDNVTGVNLLLYHTVALNTCPTGSIYAAYNLLLNQSDIINAICKRGQNSKSLNDCKAYDSEPSKPVECPKDCKDLIDKVPKGDKGDKGDKGEKGDKGQKGDKGEDGTSTGKAPSKVSVVKRSMKDLKAAFKNFTGCSINKNWYTKQWFYNPTIPTLCYRSNVQRVVLDNAKDDVGFDSGYVLIYHYQEPDSYWRPFPCLAYRTVENDFVAVICQQESSPIFINNLEPRYDEINCADDISPRKFDYKGLLYTGFVYLGILVLVFSPYILNRIYVFVRNIYLYVYGYFQIQDDDVGSVYVSEGAVSAVADDGLEDNQ